LRKYLSWKTVAVFILLAGIILSVPLLSKGQEENLSRQEGKSSVTDSVFEEEQFPDVIPTQGGWSLVKRNDEVNLLTRLVAAEATGEPYEGQVAVAAVLLNRVRHASFPNTISGVIFQPHAFESVSNGLIWRVSDLNTARRAAIDALNGWDPTYGALYFWNPYKPVSGWIWTRKIVRQIGKHVFGI
jgi:N-acetylmuramoyl-L-alanine amidase